MDYHGRRYLTLSEFQSRCRDLNVDTFLAAQEMEFYEQHRLLLPMVRTIEPESVARARQEARLKGEYDATWEVPADWDRLGRGLINFDDRMLDAEFVTNPYVESPANLDFTPWSERRISIDHDGSPLKFDLATTYYSWWQVHQLCQLREWKIFERANLIPQLRDDSWLRKYYAVPKSPETFTALHMLAEPYDLLSRYLSRDIALRMKYVDWNDDPDVEAYLRDQGAAAESIATRFDLSTVVEFLVSLQDMKEGYERRERPRMAREVERDMVATTEFADIGLGLPWEQLLVQIGIKRGEFNKRRIALLDPFEIIRRDAVHSLGYLRTLYEKDILSGTPASFPPSFAEDLVTFCDLNDLFEVVTALDNYSYSQGDLDQDRFPGFLFRRIRGLGLALEQIVKVVLESRSITTPLGTLTRAVDTLGAQGGTSWHRYFQTGVSQALVSESDGASFLQQVAAITSRQSPTDGIAERLGRTMLLACLARNATVHTPRAWSDRSEREAIGTLATACGFAIIETWWIGKQEGWIA